ncbi:sensor histidine kinase [Thermosulfurimonas dismutans]|uniref:histidine kinase n=1 Tax=Thermosulfurimonas dismutans TaxID=999894 RepID=A0A179D8C9_9BACT|nr:HAMP domain-containing sensor histidine kinase [Thermosulfurimonas dismutans]OAQ21692.1 hypothetical protein TDIS_0210 [Thermosulfurimonas dismutans]
MLENVLLGLLVLSWLGLYVLVRQNQKLRLELSKSQKSSKENPTESHKRSWLEEFTLPLALVDRKRKVLMASKALKNFSPTPDLQNLLELPFQGLLEFHERLFTKGRAENEVCWQNRWYRLQGEKIGSEEALIYLTDITREKILEERTKTLTATLAHEFRTPLTAIRGYAESMEDYLPEEDFPRKALSAILEHTERLSRLVKELLLLSSFETGLELRPEPVKAKDLLETIVSLVTPLLEEKKISLNVIGVLDFEFSGDKDYLVQAFLKILENAVKFSPEEGVITLEVETSKEYAVFKIKDQGPGIPEDLYEKIFQPFFRKDSQKGLGLGLPLARRIVEAHGGTLEAEPSFNGASFVLKIPLNSPGGSQNAHNQGGI